MTWPQEPLSESDLTRVLAHIETSCRADKEFYAKCIRELLALRRQLAEAGEALKGGQYCSRYMDDAPGVRGACESHIASKRKCVSCPNRDIHAEVNELRTQLRALAGVK
jgi:hypothetical protein